MPAAKLLIYSKLTASNQLAGGSNPSGRTKTNLIDNGRIAEQGSLPELIAKGGWFSELARQASQR